LKDLPAIASFSQEPVEEGPLSPSSSISLRKQQSSYFFPLPQKQGLFNPVEAMGQSLLSLSGIYYYRTQARMRKTFSGWKLAEIAGRD
jgi:hypothetical protein